MNKFGRLTEKNKDQWVLKGVSISALGNVKPLSDAINRLAEYENSGLEPIEVDFVKESLKMADIEIKHLKNELAEYRKGESKLE
jgi:hypothetical protein